MPNVDIEIYFSQFKTFFVENPKELKKLIVVTRGNKGAVAINKNEIEECTAKEGLQIKDLTGAGDLFAGSFLHALANNLSMEVAGKIASYAVRHLVCRANFACP